MVLGASDYDQDCHEDRHTSQGGGLREKAPQKAGSVATFSEDRQSSRNGGLHCVKAALQEACVGVSVTPDQLRAVLAEEDIHDIEGGVLSVENLRALARTMQ